MAYVTRDQVEDKIAPPVLLDALDDDGDGQEDSGRFDSIVGAASQEVDGYLAGLYAVPFADPAPAKVRAAAFVFTCELIYNRRASKVPDWLAAQVKFWRAHLEKVADRQVPFDASVDKAFQPGASVTECVSTNAQTT